MQRTTLVVQFLVYIVQVFRMQECTRGILGCIVLQLLYYDAIHFDALAEFL